VQLAATLCEQCTESLWLWTLWHYVAAASLHKPQRRANSVRGWLVVPSALLLLLLARLPLLMAQLSLWRT
jgi:hypothetical protein